MGYDKQLFQRHSIKLSYIVLRYYIVLHNIDAKACIYHYKKLFPPFKQKHVVHDTNQVKKPHHLLFFLLFSILILILYPNRAVTYITTFWKLSNFAWPPSKHCRMIVAYPKQYPNNSIMFYADTAACTKYYDVSTTSALFKPAWYITVSWTTLLYI